MSPHLIYLPETDSTNQQLQLRGRQTDLPEGTVVYTGYQTAGRGQIGNSWESEKDSNLLFSLLLRPANLHAAQQFVLSQAIALGLTDCLQQYGINALIKWPNDIYVGRQKICGILIENDLQGPYVWQSYVGIGLNVNQIVFRSPAPNPVSMRQLSGTCYSCTEVLNNLLQAIFKRYHTLQNKADIQQAYLQKLYQFEQEAHYQDAQGPFVGRITKVEENGHLLITRQDGSLGRYFFKEVAFV